MKPLIIIFGLLFLLPALCFGGPYRDKHGNAGTITLGATVVNPAASGIAYSVPYTLTDSTGNKSGEYTITSDMLPGRAPGNDDFVLNVFVNDNATERAAELIFRNNATVSPLAPVLRLLDCSSTPCTEVKVNQNAMWGALVIQDQSDIANFPIELLDARVITQLLLPAQLSQLPNSGDGTGNWAEIMENHRTNFEEAKFRMDVDFLGVTQSEKLTSLMIEEIEDKLGTADDWLVRHFPTIVHTALTFLTDHKNLIEDMTTVLHTNHVWPLDFTFPFGRMPVWLVDPNLDATAADIHVLPLHWERVIFGQAALDNPGCWHDYSPEAFVPTLLNGANNIGQFECAAVTTPNGFNDRPCTQPPDYSGLINAVETSWHNPIHGFINGSFGPAPLTAGTMVFWTFHTYASSHTLSNWRHAQKRDMPIPSKIEADVSLVKTDAPDPVAASGELTYTLTIANQGPWKATDIQVTDTLPAGVTFTNSNDPSCVLAGGAVTCTVPELLPSASTNIEIKVQVDAGLVDLTGTATLTNVASAFSSVTSDPDDTNNTVSVDTEVLPGCGGIFATIIGTPGNDNLRGTSGDDVIAGLAGNDRIAGAQGNDVMCGGLGEDRVRGGIGNDELHGGPGVDDISAGSGDDTINGGPGADKISGGPGNDFINGGPGPDDISGGPGEDRINGGMQNDTINGGPGTDNIGGSQGDDAVHGGPGNDTIAGGVGQDSIKGGTGDDILAGGLGNDNIDGGAGNDQIVGGAGTDTCVNGETVAQCN